MASGFKSVGFPLGLAQGPSGGGGGAATAGYTSVAIWAVRGIAAPHGGSTVFGQAKIQMMTRMKATLTQNASARLRSMMTMKGDLIPVSGILAKITMMLTMRGTLEPGPGGQPTSTGRWVKRSYIARHPWLKR